jgi:hypothetical protein
MVKRSLQRSPAASSVAERDLERIGLVLPEHPGTELPPTMPEDLTDIDDRHLMDLFAGFTAWSNYASTQLSKAEIDEAEAKSSVDFQEARAAIDAWEEETGTKRTVTITKARRLVEVEVQEALEEHRKLYARRKLVGAMFDVMERNIFLISRELSRRSGGSPGNMQRRSRWTP